MTAPSFAAPAPPPNAPGGPGGTGASAPASVPPTGELASLRAFDATRLARRASIHLFLDAKATRDADHSVLKESHCPHCAEAYALLASPHQYVCRLCHAEGDVYAFVRQKMRYDEKREVGYLAAVAEVARRVDSADAKAELEQRAAEAAMACGVARQWYHEQFLTAPDALAYWKARGFDQALAERLMVGFASADGFGALRELRKRGCTPAAMLDAGLITLRPNAQGTLTPRAVFRNRLLFPITDEQDLWVVAFGGRRFVDDPAAPGYDPRKYINTGHTLLWSKGATLWGLGVAAKAIAKAKHAIVVEGYFARLRLLTLGIHNVVAPCGTAMTRQQAELLVRACRADSPTGHKNGKARVTVLFDDGTEARAQAIRAGTLLLAAGAGVDLPQLPPGSDDPDTWVREAGPEPLRSLLAEAPDFIASVYAERVAACGDPLPLLDRVRLYEELVSYLLVMRSGSVQKAATEFIATRFRVPFEDIRAVIKSMKGKK